MTNEERIEKSAEEILATLETPIAGVPSVVVRNRRNALRLLRAALTAVFEGASRGASCGRCKGVGQIEVKPPPDGDPPWYGPCPVCKGEGRIDARGGGREG